jgi:hypothetical protein
MTSSMGPNANNPDIKIGILRFSGNSPIRFCRCDQPLGGKQLAPHHRVHVRATSLYRVSKDFVHSTTTQRLSWSLVGFLHRCPTC